MDADSARSTYVVTCLYGLEALLAQEVEQRIDVPAEEHWCEVVFACPGGPERLRELRLAGNVFLVLDRFRIGPTVPDLDTLDERLAALPYGLWEAQARAFQELESTDVCVSVRRKGEHNYAYTRVEEVALDAVRRATGRKTTLDARPLELRVDIHQEWCRLLGRLTVRPLSARPYRRYRMPAATEPTLAAAMVRMTEPAEGDAFLDPFCGTGTVAIERALAGPAGRIVAGDLSAKRLSWARTNAERAGADVLLAQWDAAALPFADRTFRVVCAAPPLSNPSTGRPWRLQDLGPLVAESLRVLQFGGSMVWLMSRGAIFPKAMRRIAPQWRPKRLLLSHRGRNLALFHVHKAL